jgi:hypothetical protein
VPLAAGHNMSSSGAKKPAAAKAPSGGSGNGSISDAALKLKHVKGIHEDDGDDGDDGASDARPLDAQVMALLLESMGADKHEPRVVDQLQEFVHRASFCGDGCGWLWRD